MFIEDYISSTHDGQETVQKTRHSAIATAPLTLTSLAESTSMAVFIISLQK